MMRRQHYLLDTNICIFYMKGRYNLDSVLTDKNKKYCHISEITVAELLYGASCSDRKESVLRDVERFVGEFDVVPMFSSLRTYADIKARLRSEGRLIDDFDLLIGATALHNRMILVTENIKHLSHIPDLTLENWIDRG